jgi:hypothetical protein
MELLQDKMLTADVEKSEPDRCWLLVMDDLPDDNRNFACFRSPCKGSSRHGLHSNIPYKLYDPRSWHRTGAVETHF